MILCKFTTLLLFSVDDLYTVETLILSKVKITDSEITYLVNSEFFPLNSVPNLKAVQNATLATRLGSRLLRRHKDAIAIYGFIGFYHYIFL